MFDGDAYFDTVQQDSDTVADDFDQLLDTLDKTLSALPEDNRPDAASSMPAANEHQPSFASASMPAEAERWAEFASSTAPSFFADEANEASCSGHVSTHWPIGEPDEIYDPYGGRMFI